MEAPQELLSEILHNKMVEPHPVPQATEPLRANGRLKCRSQSLKCLFRRILCKMHSRRLLLHKRFMKYRFCVHL